jgi:hypothetical protein
MVPRHTKRGRCPAAPALAERSGGDGTASPIDTSLSIWESRCWRWVRSNDLPKSRRCEGVSRSRWKAHASRRSRSLVVFSGSAALSLPSGSGDYRM